MTDDQLRQQCVEKAMDMLGHFYMHDHILRSLLSDIPDALYTEAKARREAEEALKWYASMLRPEDRLNDNGDRAEKVLQKHGGKL